jgi:hypothetical protein
MHVDAGAVGGTKAIVRKISGNVGEAQLVLVSIADPHHPKVMSVYSQKAPVGDGQSGTASVD